ncbi:transcriptional regulator ATRX-like [Vespula squamosa]|uniref:Transcriptional regulator ATRX-like n=1 Tax=Vespula squamosa TaxID=30214 RepID=A0ABD2A1R0_VESSQ
MDISAMLEVQVDEVKEVDSKENVTPKDLIPSVTIAPPPISQDENNFYKLMFGNDISIVRFRKIHCTACDVHIGSAPAQAHNMLEHPVLRTLLCTKCKEFYGDGTFEQGDDATDMFCRWCANGGNLYCCSYCSNTFCYKCIRRNFDSLVRKKIEADEKWKCFVCNPADLYAARATCWALLQHVQAVAKILQNDKGMSPEDIEERMNLDESECCPRRRKRKRRKTGSNSEDEDETYDPNLINEPVTTKRRSLKRRHKHRRITISNGTVPRLVPIKQCFSSSTENSSKPPESGSTFVSPVPIKTQENLLSSQSDQTIQEKVDPPNVKTTLYNSTINAVPTVKLLQSTAAFKPMHTIIASRVQAKNSDSDEPSAIQLMNSQNMQNMPLNKNTTVNADSQPTTAVPVALVSTDNNSSNNKTIINEVVEQPLRELCTKNFKKSEKNFSQIVFLPYKEQFNHTLDNLKVKFHQILENTRSEETSTNIIQEARSKIQHLYDEICNTVTQLACINDRIVRDYGSWERSHNTGNKVIKKLITRALSLEENNKIPLDMTCVSDTTEFVNEDVITMNPSDLVLSTNIFEAFSKKKRMISQCVGNSSIFYADKSIQVYDLESKDYEKTIGHSILMKANNNPSTKNNSSQPIITSNKHFGKYQEQFIFYLQHIEDHGIEIDDSSNDVVLESLTGIEMDSSTPKILMNEIPSINLSKSTKLNDLPTSQKNREKNRKTKTMNNVPEAELILSVSKPIPNNLRFVETSINNRDINTEVEKQRTKITSSIIPKRQNLDIKKAIETVINSLIANDTNSTENLNNATTEDDITIIED